MLTRSFYVYEFTGEYTYASGITSGLTKAMKNADTRKYLVTATKSREGASKWSINNKDFRNYTKRKLMISGIVDLVLFQPQINWQEEDFIGSL